MRFREKREDKDLSDLFVVCECSYNNKKDRLERFGTCLRCGKVLDKRAYFKRMVSRKIGKRIKGTYFDN